MAHNTAQNNTYQNIAANNKKLIIATAGYLLSWHDTGA